MQKIVQSIFCFFKILNLFIDTLEDFFTDSEANTVPQYQSFCVKEKILYKVLDA